MSAAIQFRQFMYYDKDKQQQGPALGAEMMYLYESGIINNDSYVWAEGMANWQPLKDVEELAQYLTSSSKSKPATETNTQAENEVQTTKQTKEPASDTVATDPEKKKKKKKKKNRNKKTWVYVSGLPEDVTEEELEKHFSKVGFLQEDAVEMKKMIKIYRDPETGKAKGDASVCYLQEPSVELALTILDDAPLRDSQPDKRLKVERANFSKSDHAKSDNAAKVDGSDTQKNKPKRKKRGDDWDRAVKLRKLKQRQALSWNDDGIGDEFGLKIVVIKHIFTLDEMKSPNFAEELQESLGSECSKVGNVKKITVFEKNPEGVVVVKYDSARGAEKCVDVMNGRWFSKRKLECFFWDGKTDYRVRATEEEEKERIDSFGDWLEGKDSDEEDKNEP